MNREFDNHLSARSGALSVSKIREIAELGFDQSNVIPLWFGEGAWPSAENIVSSAVASLEAGDHFYQPNSGKMALREEVVRYTNRIYNAQLMCRMSWSPRRGLRGWRSLPKRSFHQATELWCSNQAGLTFPRRSKSPERT